MAKGNRKNSIDFTVNVDVITKTSKQIDSYVEKLREIKSTIGNRLAANFLDSAISQTKSAQKELNSFIKIINNPKLSAKERFAGIDGVVKSYSKLSGIIKNMDKNWLEHAQVNNKKFLTQLDEIQKKRKDLSTQKGNITRAKNSMKKSEDALAAMGYEGGFGKTDIDKLNKRMQKIRSQIVSNKNKGLLDNSALEEELQTIKEMKKEVTNVMNQRKNLKSYADNIEKITAYDGRKGVREIDAGERRVNKDYQELLLQTEDPAVAEALGKTLQDTSKNMEGLLISSDALNASLVKGFRASQREAEELAETGQTLRQIFAQFGIGFSAQQVVNGFVDIAKSAYNFYKSLDAALNEIYVVSDLTSEAVDGLKDNFIKMAEDTGMALDDVTRAATLFYQQGLSTSEVMEMTEVTAQFAKVAGIDATSAANKLTAAVNGYCLSAEDASLVADKFNKVAAASAADINELSTAFSKAAAQANQAGIGMDNYLAYIATMVEATREAPENIGTSLKTIMARMQQVKEAGTTEDGETDVNKVETALESVGIALRDTQGELRDLEDVFDELGPKWQSLDRNTQAYLGTIIAGTRQQSRFITLMQNWDRVLELSEDSANSAGQQALMHAKAMESITSKAQQLNVAWQEFISNLANSGVIKSIIDLLTDLVGLFNDGYMPLRLLGTGIALFRKQIGTGLVSLGKWMRNQLSWTKALKTTDRALVKSTKGIKGFFNSFKIRGNVLANNAKELDAVNKRITQYQTLMDKNIANIAKYEKAGNAEALKKESDALKYNEEMLQLNKNKRDELLDANTALIGSMNGVINVGMTLTTIFQGAASSNNEFISTVGKSFSVIIGFMTLITAATVGIVAFGKAAGKVADEVKYKLIETGIGAIVVAVGVAMSLITQVVDGLTVTSADIANSVEDVGQALENYSNKKVAIKSVERSLDKYESLKNQIYLTAAEQEKLNALAQELADSLGLEVVEDKYGNLSVSIEDVNEKLQKMKNEAAKAKEELAKAENEAIEEYDHSGRVNEFFEKYVKSYRGEIRDAMGEINTGLKTTELKTSAENVQNIMKNLKDEIINDTMEMSEAFEFVGNDWSLTQEVESLFAAFENADIDPDNWNDLYATIDNVEQNIESLSYNDALGVIEGAVRAWGEAAELTTAQIEQMTQAVMKSLYGGTTGKIQEYNEITGTRNYDEEINAIEKKMIELEKESTTFDNMFKQDEAEKQYEYYEKQKELLEEERDARKEFDEIEKELAEMYASGVIDHERENELLERRNELAKEYNFYTAEETALARERANVLGQFNKEGQAFMDSTGIYDEENSELFEKMMSDNQFAKISDAFKTEGSEEGRKTMTNYLIDLIKNSDDEKIKKQAQDTLDKIFDNIKIGGTPSWGDLGKTITNATGPLQKMNSIMSEIKENGGMTLDTFIELCDILDSIDLAEVYDAGKMGEFIAAIQSLKLDFDESTGLILANGNAMESIQDIMIKTAQVKMAQTANELEADKKSLQSQIWTIEAEIEANEALIRYLEDVGGETVSLYEIEQAGQVAYAKTMGEVSGLVVGLYDDMANASSTWSTVSITNAVAVGEAIKKAIAGELGKEALEAELKNIMGTWTFKDSGSYKKLQLLDTDGDQQVNRLEAIKTLREHNAQGWKTIDKLYSQMKGIEEMQSLLRKMSEADLSNLGIDPEKLDVYLGQLEEIYNQLRKIEGIQSRLNHLEMYDAIAQGKDKARFLKERIDLSHQLIAENEQLVKQQKYLEQTEQNAIKNSAVGDVFSFDEYGNIIMDYEKYLKLQNTAAEGQMSEMELADKLYEEYKEIHETTLDYYEQLVDSIQSTIDIQQELVDNYIAFENEIAEAVKDTYQNMLDNKLEAIDTEIEALERLREARDRANQAREDSEALSDLQTSLKRAMMDTSGASNTKVLSYQDQIKEKLEEMGEDEYTRRLDAITEALEEEKEQLQRNFDEFFEDWSSFHEMIEKRILVSQEATLEALRETDAYKKASDEERAEMEKAWKTNYTTTVSALKETGLTIEGIQNVITGLENTIAAKFDALLQNNAAVVEVGTLLSRVLGENKIANNTTSNKTSSTTSSNTTSSNTKPSTSYKTDKTAAHVSSTNITNKEIYDQIQKEKEDAEVEKYKQKILKEQKERSTFTGSFRDYVESGDTVELKPGNGKSITGYESVNGGKTKTWTDKENGDYNFKFQGNIRYAKNLTAPSGTLGMWMGEFKRLGSTWWLPMSWNGINDEDGKIWYWNNKKKIFKTGGLADFTGPAWLDGTKSSPEAVLNAAQTKAFMRLGRYLELTERTTGNIRNAYIDNDTPEVYIESIDFHVDNMSSVEDGKIAFDAFVDEFKRIGRRTGIAIERFKI